MQICIFDLLFFLQCFGADLHFRFVGLVAHAQSHQIHAHKKRTLNAVFSKVTCAVKVPFLPDPLTHVRPQVPYLYLALHATLLFTEIESTTGVTCL